MCLQSLSKANMMYQQSKLVKSGGYLPNLFFFFVQSKVSSFCFPVDLWWKYRNKSGECATKKSVTLKDVHFVWQIWIAKTSYQLQINCGFVPHHLHWKYSRKGFLNVQYEKEE